MTTHSILISEIVVGDRKRPLDSATVLDLKKSIEQQGLLQNIGVQETADGYRLVFGAHRLEAVKALNWTEIQARIFPADTSDDECVLAELQENNARKELTGAERKAFAAEVGRICLKLEEKSKEDGESNLDTNWILDFADKSGLSKATAHNWWAAFTKAAGLSITPKQATDENRQAFFAWLDEQKAKEEAAKATKAAEQEAERKRKEEEATARRLGKEKTELMEYLDATVKEWGRDVVEQWVKEWLLSPA